MAAAAKVSAPAVLEKAVRGFADTERDSFRDAIFRQGFKSFAAHPLSEKYLARKRALRRDERVMIATRHYVNSIKVHRERMDDRSVVYWIGFDPDAIAWDLHMRPTQIRLNTVARIHEYGAPGGLSPSAQRIPARPHWGPHLKAMRGRAPDTRRAIRRAVRAVLERGMR